MKTIETFGVTINVHIQTFRPTVAAYAKTCRSIRKGGLWPPSAFLETNHDQTAK